VRTLLDETLRASLQRDSWAKTLRYQRFVYALTGCSLIQLLVSRILGKVLVTNQKRRCGRSRLPEIRSHFPYLVLEDDGFQGCCSCGTAFLGDPTPDLYRVKAALLCTANNLESVEGCLSTWKHG